MSLTFSRDVDVEGSPSITLETGGGDKEAQYASGTGTDTLVLEYEVQTFDEDSDGIAVAENSLALNGGNIKDGEENVATLDHSSIAFTEHKVEAIAHSFSSAQTSSDGETVTITFSEDVDISPEYRSLSTFAGVDIEVCLRVLFDVFADDHRMHAIEATISGADLTLTLDTPINEIQDVEVSFDNAFTSDLSGIVVDDAGNPLVQLSSEPSTNDSTVAEDEEAIWPVLRNYLKTSGQLNQNRPRLTFSSPP